MTLAWAADRLWRYAPRCAALLQSLGRASYEEIERALAEREPAEPESGLTPEVVSRLRERLA